MIRPNFDQRLQTARLQRAGDARGTTLLQAGVVPHALAIERDGASPWEVARGTRPLGGTAARPPRTEVLRLGRIPRLY
ncbi:MAG: hypothetical protein FJZ01_07490 [Candidatus Sericytochromatia bacterium]|nr:hypothetical protein [Candidatus Tanganyikabacteria bacterium]